jgi:hypothetical protein
LQAVFDTDVARFNSLLKGKHLQPVRVTDVQALTP